MVRYCIVVGCINSKEKRKEKNELKLQKNSLFTVPRNTQIVKQWSTILRQNWDFDPKCKQFICDEHFDEQYIIRKDIITIPGQQPFISERNKIVLKRDAVPTLNKNTSTSENEIENTVNNICESVTVMSEESVINEESVDLMTEDWTIEPNIIREVECRNSELSESHINFSIHDIIQSLEIHKLPKKWSWVNDHHDTPGVILCYLDYESYDVKYRVKLDKVLNVIITNVKINKSRESDVIISSMAKFWEFLRKLERYPMCSGSGFACQKSSDTCIVFLTDEEKIKKQAALYRCEACRKLRIKLRNQFYRPKMDFEEHNKKLKLELDALKKKCAHLSYKNEALKQAIEEQRKECANASRTIILKKILTLPPIQQESVSFAPTKLKTYSRINI